MDFLGVSTSLTGRTWVGPSGPLLRSTEAMVQRTALPQALCATLARLDVQSDEAEAYLSPQLRNLMPDPQSLCDMQKASARLIAAINSGEKIAIFADYDVDGATSAALICLWLRHFGCTPTLYVPDRIDEGY
ncbi:MAG: single-stranded-DNA-specific exonuclease RecJ, partial [Paracoccaceae bacterium]|nr:single-stranded-DNA-specific exonuclease RecJ [Paracoccaceae bacterium]